MKKEIIPGVVLYSNKSTKNGTIKGDLIYCGDIILAKDGKELVTLSHGCYGERATKYWFNKNYNQLKRVVIMADTIKEAKGTENEMFFREWLKDLCAYWGKIIGEDTIMGIMNDYIGF